jgi:hypothetical protein
MEKRRRALSSGTLETKRYRNHHYFISTAVSSFTRLQGEGLARGSANQRTSAAPAARAIRVTKNARRRAPEGRRFQGPERAPAGRRGGRAQPKTSAPAVAWSKLAFRRRRGGRYERVRGWKSARRGETRDRGGENTSRNE